MDRMHIPIRACIFDMDGLLLNTEDLITKCINIILAKYDKPNLPWSVKARIQGRTARESNAILLEWAQLPITEEDYVAQLKSLHDRVFPTAEPLPGVQKLLKGLEMRGSVAMALATSSSQQKFAVKTTRWTSLFECFPDDRRVLGDDVRVVHHKPAPDIYLCALQCINNERGDSISTQQCLVFEDSIQGVEAGRRAGMAVIWCPHPSLLHELLHGPAEDVQSNFRTVFGLGNAAIQTMEVTDLAQLINKTSEGWIRLLPTLEDFPFGQYGL